MTTSTATTGIQIKAAPIKMSSMTAANSPTTSMTAQSRTADSGHVDALRAARFCAEGSRHGGEGQLRDRRPAPVRRDDFRLDARPFRRAIIVEIVVEHVCSALSAVALPYM